MGNCTISLIMLFIIFTNIHIHTAATTSPNTTLCIESERKALMDFRGSFDLPIWGGHDCCSWGEITCDNLTGHVIEINCRMCHLIGPINSSLLNLEHLEYLDLSNSDFSRYPIPAFLGSMKNLQHLDLSYTKIGGEIPPQLGNLSKLQHLSLGGDRFLKNPPLSAKSLTWITGLSSLKSLDISLANLSECSDWLDSVNKLSSLSSLRLSSCNLDSTVMSGVPYVNNLTSLVSLDLSGNIFSSCTFPIWLFDLSRLESLSILNTGMEGPLPNMFKNLTSLTSLYLRRNKFSGEIPSELGYLPNLTSLDLSHNHFDSLIPSSFGNLQNLRYLVLSDNQLSGSIPLTFGNLAKLEYFSLYNNSLTVELSESLFEGLRRLQSLVLSNNHVVVFNVSSEYMPRSQISSLEDVEMESVFIGTEFPHFLQTLSNLKTLVMRNANISGPIPTILSANLEGLQLSGNQLNGSIPEELCSLKSLIVLSLAKNQLTGKIPLCLGNLLQLQVLDLASNGFSGHIPMELGSLGYLKFLHLNKNKLVGELPTSLQNMRVLKTLDLGENGLHGAIPEWIGDKLSGLHYLRLESNKFSSDISVNLCKLPFLQVLNLATNNLSGIIPPCLGNLSMMLTEESNDFDAIRSVVIDSDNHGSYIDTVQNIIKGIQMEYSSSIWYAKFISLSGNKLHGEIPDELMNLQGLQSLNLSNNDLSRRIPEMIGNLTHLESLDLSLNQLSGTIPQSLAGIDNLGYFNLSFNNLVGRLPSGNHFNTLQNPSCYLGNTGLCGKPLNRSCHGDVDDLVPFNKKEPLLEDDNNVIQWPWLYAGIGPGFAAGFLGVVFILYFNNSWWYAYFRFVDNMYNHRRM